jgi:hypothetical protein
MVILDREAICSVRIASRVDVYSASDLQSMCLPPAFLKGDSINHYQFAGTLKRILDSWHGASKREVVVLVLITHTSRSHRRATSSFEATVKINCLSH